MYNICYAEANQRSGCGHLGTWGLWGNTCNRQTVCRDCCGNLHVQNVNGCGCGCLFRNYGQQNTCGGGTDTVDNGNTGNGIFRCFTICGVNNTAQTATTGDNGDAYYARQYGLGCGRRTGCGCGCYN